MSHTKLQDSGFVVPVTTVSSPAKALQTIVEKRLTGRLTVGDPSDPSIFWRVFVGDGKLHFATSAMGQKERLAYFLQWYYPELELVQLDKFQSDYDVVCYYWQTGKLSLQQARKLLFWLTQEAMTQLLALPQATLQFEKTVGLDPLLLSVPLKQMVVPMRGWIGQWVRRRPEVNSPFARPQIQDKEKFAKIIWHQVQDIGFIKSLIKVFNENACIYEAACHLKTDTLSLATLLQPAVKAGIVNMQSYHYADQKNRGVIACIDDSKSIQRTVKLTLEAAGYQVITLSQPSAALTKLARHKPDLILMDINMPEINGYELCRMLRQSTLLREVPIVMLTGRDGIVDKLRARMVGANDYLTKPFQPQQLVGMVESNLQNAAVYSQSSTATQLQTSLAGA